MAKAKGRRGRTKLNKAPHAWKHKRDHFSNNEEGGYCGPRKVKTEGDPKSAVEQGETRSARET